MEMEDLQTLAHESIELLKQLISIPSFSKEEEETADKIAEYITAKGVLIHRKGNNIWCYNEHFDKNKPTILLNSHHDTVKPNPGYTNDPFEPIVDNGKLYGLGSNDAGGALISLLTVFLYFYDCRTLKYNLCFAATAEEEISGKNGIETILGDIGELDFAIVGEPTLMQLAIAERGLMVIDCEAMGKAGHAARNEGENAIYKAIADINWFKSYKFPKESSLFGPISMNVTIIEGGSQHNVVPASCKFTVDVRVTDAYRNEEVLEIIKANIKSNATARSTRLKPSSISPEHPIVQAGLDLGRKTYGSPTTSDQALLDVPSLKLGPGDSARSHMANEYIYLNEIEDGINLYIEMLKSILI